MKIDSFKETMPTIEEILIIGKHNQQIDFKSINTSEDIQNYLKLTKGTEVGIMNYDFPKEEWNNKWIKWLCDQKKEKEIYFRIMGGPRVQAQEELHQLLKNKTIDLHLCPALETFHIIYVKDPKQLWIEQYHVTHTAYGVHYTDNPLESAWTNGLNYFNTIWDASKPIKEKEI